MTMIYECKAGSTVVVCCVVLTLRHFLPLCVCFVESSTVRAFVRQTEAHCALVCATQLLRLVHFYRSLFHIIGYAIQIYFFSPSQHVSLYSLNEH
jgi:hypothetical protein